MNETGPGHLTIKVRDSGAPLSGFEFQLFRPLAGRRWRASLTSSRLNGDNASVSGWVTRREVLGTGSGTQHRAEGRVGRMETKKYDAVRGNMTGPPIDKWKQKAMNGALRGTPSKALQRAIFEQGHGAGFLGGVRETQTPKGYGFVWVCQL